MQNVNSTNQFSQLKHDLEAEDREIHALEDAIRRKEIDVKRTREVFEKVEKEMNVLVQKKAELMQRRTHLQGELKNFERSLEEAARHNAGSQLKF